MCTAILFHRTHPRYPMIIAANRDEQYARPVRGVEVVPFDDAQGERGRDDAQGERGRDDAQGERGRDDAQGERGRIVAGIDAEKGGSWAGATAAGGFALLTNRRRRDLTVKARQSRGEIVLACLRAGTLAAMRDVVVALEPQAFGPFNLVFGDGSGAELAVSQEGASEVTVSAIPDGIHVLTHESLDAPAQGKIARARELFSPLAQAPWPDFQPAAHAALADHQHPGLADHTPPPGPPPQPALADALSAICVHTEYYGTRSATLLAIAEDHTAHYLYAPGPPCETDFSDVTALLSQ